MTTKAPNENDGTQDPILMTKQGKPFANEQAANMVLRSKKLDEQGYAVVPYEDGFVLANVERLHQATPRPPEGPTEPMEPTGYWVVKFQARGTEQDTIMVELKVNQQTLQVSREREIILPDSFLEAADHATYQVFEQRPGHDRKIVGKVKRYPYERLRMATKDEFDRMYTQGNEVREREHLERILRTEAATVGSQG